MAYMHPGGAYCYELIFILKKCNYETPQYTQRYPKAQKYLRSFPSHGVICDYNPKDLSQKLDKCYWKLCDNFFGIPSKHNGHKINQKIRKWSEELFALCCSLIQTSVQWCVPPLNKSALIVQHWGEVRWWRFATLPWPDAALWCLLITRPYHQPFLCSGGRIRVVGVMLGPGWEFIGQRQVSTDIAIFWSVQV